MKLCSAARSTGLRCRSVPRLISLTLRRVVDVVKLTVFGHSQSLALERSHYTHRTPLTVFTVTQLCPPLWARTRVSLFIHSFVNSLIQNLLQTAQPIPKVVQNRQTDRQTNERTNKHTYKKSYLYDKIQNSECQKHKQLVHKQTLLAVFVAAFINSTFQTLGVQYNG